MPTGATPSAKRPGKKRWSSPAASYDAGGEHRCDEHQQHQAGCLTRHIGPAPAHGDADVRLLPNHFFGDVASVFLNQRVGLVSGEGTVDFEAQPLGLRRECLEQLGRDKSRHPAAGIPNSYNIPEPPEAVHWDSPLAREGARVAVADRTEESAAATVALPYDQAVEHTRAALKEQGFGVLFRGLIGMVGSTHPVPSAAGPSTCWASIASSCSRPSRRCP